MRYKWSAGTGGFYDTRLKYPNLPADCIDISDGDYQALLAGRAGIPPRNGQSGVPARAIVRGDDGYPQLVDIA